MYLAQVKMVAAVAAAVIVTGTAVPVGIAVAQATGKDEAPKTNTASVVDDSTAMYLRAVAQMRAKDYKAAIQTFETLLQTYPDAKTIRPEALYWLGDCYTKAGDPAAAKRVWEELNSEFPESNWGKYARGGLSADSTFLGSLPPRPDYEVSLTEADFKMLDAFEATILGKANKHFAKKEPKEYELAAAAYNSFVVEYPRSKAVPYALVRKGRALQFVGKRNEAIRVYRDVVDYFPDSNANAVPALLYLAQCHYLNGNAKEATKAIAQLRADKDYGKHEAAACATFLLAQMQADDGKIDEALATLGTIDVPFPAYAALAQLRQAEVYEKAGRTSEAIAAYRATMTKYPGTPESTLAHNALEKMGSRSPDATHVALTGKPATIKGTAIPQIEPANEHVKKYLGNLRARADGMEGLLPIVTMSDADRSVAIPEIIKMLRDPTPIPGTGGGGPVGPDGSGGRRVVVRNRAAEALSLAAGISFGFFFVMEDKNMGEAEEKQIAEAVIGRVETWWATAQGKTRAQWLKDRLPDLQRQIDDVQKNSLANHSLLIIAATGDRTAADTLLEAVEKHVPKLEFKPLQKDAMTALMEEIARALAKLGDRKMIPRLVAVGRQINRPEVAYNNKLLFHFAQTLNKWAGGLKLDPFESKTYNLDMNGKPMIRADVEVIAPAAFDTWLRMAE